jgi:hypothetical protein
MDGDHRLDGARAKLVLASVIDMVDRLRRRKRPLKVGARAFDRLRHERQSLAVLDVARRILDDSPAAELEAWSEAAVYAIFENVCRRLTREVVWKPGPAKTQWRTLVRDAFVEGWTAGDDCIPAVESRKLVDWEWCVEVLTDELLQDRDFLDEDLYDGIEALPEYFIGGPPERSAKEEAELARFLDWARSVVELRSA